MVKKKKLSYMGRPSCLQATLGKLSSGTHTVNHSLPSRISTRPLSGNCEPVRRTCSRSVKIRF